MLSLSIGLHMLYRSTMLWCMVHDQRRTHIMNVGVRRTKKKDRKK